MPTALGQRFSSNFFGQPPRMSPEDFEIWRRWWPTIMTDHASLYFDVGLGLPDSLPETHDSKQLAGWIRNTQKRADVIIERADEVWLVELRFNAQSSAIGRLLTYQQLLIDDNPFQKPVSPYLVTNKFDSEVRRIAEALGIAYVVA
jgi:hypothetical protein